MGPFRPEAIGARNFLPRRISLFPSSLVSQGWFRSKGGEQYNTSQRQSRKGEGSNGQNGVGFGSGLDGDLAEGACVRRRGHRRGGDGGAGGAPGEARLRARDARLGARLRHHSGEVTAYLRRCMATLFGRCQASLLVHQALS
jgi:hypothetical protein